jgi:hypothetical protein
MVATLRTILERDLKSVEFLANLRSVAMPPARPGAGGEASVSDAGA